MTPMPDVLRTDGPEMRADLNSGLVVSMLIHATATRSRRSKSQNEGRTGESP